MTTSRRQFLESIGSGMLAAGLGATLAQNLGFSTAFAQDGSDTLTFGEYDALVDLMQSTPPDKLQSVLIEKLDRGQTELPQLIRAAALANAETFGGEDYVGFHTAMAMLPALQMTEQLLSARRPLPVLKVLYRNAQQIQELGGSSKKTLRRMHAAEEATIDDVGIAIRDACRSADLPQAAKLFASTHTNSIKENFNILQPVMQDDINVHRFVFAYRTYGLAELLGNQHAYTILRQCVRFCCHDEQHRIDKRHAESPIRKLMPKLLDEYKLEGKRPGSRDPGDDAIEELSRTIYAGPGDRSAEAVAAALAERIDPESVGEAISLASNLMVLRQGPDKWRTHGDSAGVHSSDSTNAWRNMARLAETRYAMSGLICAAYHVGVYRPFSTEPYPTAEHRSAIKSTDAGGLLAEAEDAILHNDQGRAAAAVAAYGESGYPSEPVFQKMLQYTISEDGRLHGEKYYQTVCEEFRTTRPAFRWRQLIGLARVTASAYGYDRKDQHGGRAPGYAEACRQLKISA